jgi:hypothetical protein
MDLVSISPCFDSVLFPRVSLREPPLPPGLLLYISFLCFTVCAPSPFFFEFSYCLDRRQGAQNMRTFPYLSEFLVSHMHHLLSRCLGALSRAPRWL